MQILKAIAALVLTLLAVAVAGCDSDNKPTPGATPSASPTSTAPTVGPDACPVDQEICDFASEVQRLIASADFARLEAVMSPQQFVCPDREVGLGDPIPLCDGAEGGEVREGYQISRLQSHGTVELSVLPMFRWALIQDADREGRSYAEPHVIGIHCPAIADSPNCADQFMVMLSIQGPPASVVVQREDEALRIIGLQFGTTLDNPLDILTHGGDPPYAWGDLREGWFYAWKGAQIPDPERTVARGWLLAPPEITGVVVSPASGQCPATLTLTFPEAPEARPGKEPLPSVWVVAGVSGVEVGIPGRPPFVEQKPPWLADGRSFVVQLGAEMLGGTLCEGDTISLLVGGGPDGTLLAGYAIER